MIRIGANPICWSNDDLPEIGGNIPLEQCLSEARQAGFVGIELGNKFPRTAKALGPILEAHGQALISGWYSIELLRRNVGAEWNEIRPHADLLKSLGARVLIVAETSNAIHAQKDIPLSARPVLEKSRWREFGAMLTELAKRLKDEDGLTLVYHHHMGTIVQTEAEIDRLLEVTGTDVGLLLDTGHAIWGGADPVRLARHYRERVGHVHTKDVREDKMWLAGREDFSFLDAVLAGVYTVPGDGFIDFPAVLEALPDYSGWVVVEAEQDPTKAPPAEYTKLGFTNLSRYLRQSGLV